MGGQAKSKKKNKPRRKDRQSNGDSGQRGLSAEERMKLKMQEKAKKKTAEKYTAEQLLEKTEECTDNFNFEMAQMFLLWEMNEDASLIICYVFLKAVELSPEEGHGKYMYLGQIHTGMEAVQYFSKGIEVMLNTLEERTQSAEGAAAAVSDNDPELTGKDVSVAFCSVAEIFFTDLCMQEGAAERCKEAIERALQYDPDNPEALQLMASYLFSTENIQDGREFLMRSVALWLPSHRSEAEPCGRGEDAEDEEHQQSEIPPYESRITTAKLLVEAEEYEDLRIAARRTASLALTCHFFFSEAAGFLYDSAEEERSAAEKFPDSPFPSARFSEPREAAQLRKYTGRGNFLRGDRPPKNRDAAHPVPRPLPRFPLQ
ncbi:hypothetical protein SKAU_G00214900 [Synaphobranchus kaupii]|uniref:Assembly chaperone of rpl4 n=1 Tax=Synaphobranchus kaupii TaxID=118154 RepID=A0A9Q1FA18_SYNKA|nr:hypothetical protein SKAU_G00214900 [Synaphobranchus kaupii]